MKQNSVVMHKFFLFFSSITVENPVGQKFSILMKITNIVQQRKWTLPQLKFNQVQNLIDRLKVNKSPDYFGFSAKHIKLGAMVAVKYLKDYLNLSHTLNMEFQKVNLWDSVILFINLGENLYRNHRASEKLLYVHFLANSNIWRLSVTLLFPYSGLSSPLLSWASPLLVCQAGQHHGH